MELKKILVYFILGLVDDLCDTSTGPTTDTTHLMLKQSIIFENVMSCSCHVKGQFMIGLIDVRLHQNDMSCSTCILTATNLTRCETGSECSDELLCIDGPWYNDFDTFSDVSSGIIALSGMFSTSVPVMVWLQVKGRRITESCISVYFK